MGNGHSFNLEDLASGQSNTLVATNTWTRIALLALATLWILLLITAAGQKTNTWYLLAVGGIGILQNIYVAGAQRSPKNFGVPLEYIAVFGETSVIETLFQVEEQYKDVGRLLLGEFFPGDLREKTRWETLKNTWAEKAAEEGKVVEERRVAEKKKAGAKQPS